jgi:pimeloyl-ACP methyl ester carboxylesterase
VRKDPQASWIAKLGIGFVKWPGVMWLVDLEFYLRTGVNLNSTKVDAMEAVRALRTTPVLFLAGENDPIAPAADTECMFEAAPTPQKRIVVLPKATHSTYTPETKDAYEAAVLDFLGWAIGRTSKARRPNGADRFDRHARIEAPEQHDRSGPRP